MFQNRRDAGWRLAERILGLGVQAVAAIPRGGVIVGDEVARRLGVPLDIVVARKLRAPDWPELAVGAVAGGIRPQVVMNRPMLRRMSLTVADLRNEIAVQSEEVDRMEMLCRSSCPAVDVRGKTVALVDDGLATGATARVAARALRAAGSERVILAVPVLPRAEWDVLNALMDGVISLMVADSFSFVGRFYEDFAAVEDEDVAACLRLSFLSRAA